MFEYDYKYAILLDKLRIGKIAFLFNLDTLYSGGGVNYSFRWTYSHFTIYTNVLYCFTVVCHCIYIKHLFQGEYAE